MFDKPSSWLSRENHLVEELLFKPVWLWAVEPPASCYWKYLQVMATWNEASVGFTSELSVCCCTDFEWYTSITWYNM